VTKDFIFFSTPEDERGAEAAAKEALQKS